MRIRHTLVGVAIIVGVCAAPALAGPLEEFPRPENKYEGRLADDPQTYFGFNPKHKSGKLIVRKVFVRSAFECANGVSGYEQFPVPGRFRVNRRGEFEGRKRFRLAPPGSPTLPFVVKLSGELGKRGEAAGEFSFRARPYHGPGRARDRVRCKSGRVPWEAKRGAEVRPEKLRTE
jgi:hypothetical protein